MELNKILNCEYSIEIDELSIDSRAKTNNGLYFCLSGNVDGHNYAKQAVDNGAVALVCERRLDLPVPQIIVSDSRAAMSMAAAAYYGNPQRELIMVGITGTNGKTTTSFIVQSILKRYNKKAAVIGTNGVFYSDKYISSQLTTPDPIELFGILRQIVDSGVQYVIMEVSAHAAALSKIKGITFDVAAFTNLTQDHLDFFGDMESYFSAKRDWLLTGKSIVINADDSYGLKLIKQSEKAITYGYNNPSDVFGINLKMSEHGLSYILNLMDEIVRVKFSLPGRFNMYNTMCAAAICYLLKVPSSIIQEGIKRVKKIDGRFNIINTTICSIIIDFAHTDDGLSNVLRAIKEFATGKIITVFGCGGNRDSSKRSKMGKAASQFSDYVVITSDNPRYENPMDIMIEIQKGVTCEHTLIVDRREAIRCAIKKAKKNDIVLIAGKGAEKYQEIDGIKIPYCDEDFVMQLVAEERI
ncbi:MAG: UDP-N-acetylmuramoyl-L-alanyl-D-glutamate--2,6-diaminopimelate ligase [Clostridia bacterium]|nr:UDP-N-acetylmuramoyl-L-alanyl-D-glutamate--2,6-diaminopimelate ligase [Clostridia bacterium]